MYFVGGKCRCAGLFIFSVYCCSHSQHLAIFLSQLYLLNRVNCSSTVERESEYIVFTDTAT